MEFFFIIKQFQVYNRNFLDEILLLKGSEMCISEGAFIFGAILVRVTFYLSFYM